MAEYAESMTIGDKKAPEATAEAEEETPSAISGMAADFIDLLAPAPEPDGCPIEVPDNVGAQSQRTLLKQRA